MGQRRYRSPAPHRPAALAIRLPLLRFGRGAPAPPDESFLKNTERSTELVPLRVIPALFYVPLGCPSTPSPFPPWLEAVLPAVSKTSKLRWLPVYPGR
ncbi:hypothetical protein F4802DRAFT_551251 [Xylaria palmicola]|nr:hypothetical protein F4802DRAFT_551251 [Xylaria palmicola]